MAVPYVEFTELNFCLEEVKRKIKTGENIVFLMDNNDPSNIKTYMYLQNNLGAPVSPTIPSGWSTSKIEYKHDVELKFNTNGNTKYLLDDNYTVYLRIN